MQLKIIKNQKAFTILEVIVALGIVSVSIVSILTVNLQAMKVTASNNRQMIASMLTQEGLEMIRNKRDSNWLNPGFPNTVSWDNEIEGASAPGDIYNMDYTDSAPNTACNSFSDSCSDLSISLAGFYDHGIGEKTIYKRLITITRLDADSIKVKSEVKWQEGGEIKSYSASMKLYNWYE